MRAFFPVLAFSLALPRLVLGGTCCLGGGPKSFIQLRELQTYQIGISSSFKDTYGRFDPYGDLYRADKSQTLTLSIGVGARFLEDLEASAILPWVYQYTEIVGKRGAASNVGDAVLGARYFLVRNLFRDEWHPTVILLGGVKAPSGTVDTFSSDGKLTPGTGNGIWEPYLGVAFQKDLGLFIAGLTATYTGRIGRTLPGPSGGSIVAKEGDRIELSESLTFQLSRRLSIVFGSAQMWDFSSRVNDRLIPGSEARGVTVFGSASYFLTRFWSLTVAGESSLPIARLGVNQLAARSVALTSTYSFY